MIFNWFDVGRSVKTRMLITAKLSVENSLLAVYAENKAKYNEVSEFICDTNSHTIVCKLNGMHT